MLFVRKSVAFHQELDIYLNISPVKMLFRLAATLASCVISGAAASPVVPVPAYVNGWYSAGKRFPRACIFIFARRK